MADAADAASGVLLVLSQGVEARYDMVGSVLCASDHGALREQPQVHTLRLYVYFW
jgi:hypothetical protein